MSFVDQEIFTSVKSHLLSNKEARFKRGPFYQDFASGGCLPGEVFYGNLKDAAFEALPFKTKRKDAPARTTSVLSQTYEKLYGEKEKGYFAVFVHTYELEILGIEY